jgi:TRAP-type C4-dicarboxylate transport system permease small subunit
MKLAEKMIALVSRWLNNIGMVFLTFLMLVITADVLLRGILNKPIRGANEIAELTMLVIVFLGIAYAQYAKANISVSILFDKFPGKVQDILNVFIYLLCLGICGVILWQTFSYHSYLTELKRTTLILEIPVAPFQIIMIIGFFMLCIVLIIDVIYSVRKVVNK